VRDANFLQFILQQFQKVNNNAATPPKDLSTVLVRKCPRAESPEDELDADEPLAPNTMEREQIEWKRRENVLAAKSRRRKLRVSAGEC